MGRIRLSNYVSQLCLDFRGDVSLPAHHASDQVTSYENWLLFTRQKLRKILIQEIAKEEAEKVNPLFQDLFTISGDVEKKAESPEARSCCFELPKVSQNLLASWDFNPFLQNNRSRKMKEHDSWRTPLPIVAVEPWLSPRKAESR